MLYAYNHNNEFVTATPGQRATCPECSSVLIAKCGDIYPRHWSHSNKRGCNQWAGGESAWHLGWKSLAVQSACEVTIGNHRADIVAANGLVVELQYRTLPPAEIAARETHYRRMVWMFHAADFWDRLRFCRKGRSWRFTWSYPRPSIYAIRQALFFDPDDGSGRLFQVKKIDPHQPRGRGNGDGYCPGKKCTGWGSWLTKEDFLTTYLRGRLRAA